MDVEQIKLKVLFDKTHKNWAVQRKSAIPSNYAQTAKSRMQITISFLWKSASGQYF